MDGNDTRRLSVGAVQAKFREFAENLSFIKDHELEGYNPCRPHSLRSAFRSRLTGKTDPDLIEFFMGHAIGGVKRAYLNLPIDELRELYSNSCEPFLATEKTSKDELIERKVIKIPPETEERIKHLEARLTKLIVENESLGEDNHGLRAQLQTNTDKLAQQDAKLAKIERILTTFQERIGVS